MISDQDRSTITRQIWVLHQAEAEVRRTINILALVTLIQFVLLMGVLIRDRRESYFSLVLWIAIIWGCAAWWRHDLARAAVESLISRLTVVGWHKNRPLCGVTGLACGAVVAIIWAVAFVFLWQLTSLPRFGAVVTKLAAIYLGWRAARGLGQSLNRPFFDCFPDLRECAAYLAMVLERYPKPPRLSDLILDSLGEVRRFSRDSVQLGPLGNAYKERIAKKLPYTDRLAETAQALLNWEDKESDARVWFDECLRDLEPSLRDHVAEAERAARCDHQASRGLNRGEPETCPECHGRGQGPIHREHRELIDVIEGPMGPLPKTRVTVTRTGTWVCSTCQGTGVISRTRPYDETLVHDRVFREQLQKLFLARHQTELVQRWGEPVVLAHRLLQETRPGSSVAT